MPPGGSKCSADLDGVTFEPLSTCPANALDIQQGSAPRTYQTSTLRMLERLAFHIAASRKWSALPSASAGSSDAVRGVACPTFAQQSECRCSGGASTACAWFGEWLAWRQDLHGRV